MKQRMLLIFNPKSGVEEFRLNMFEIVEKFTKSGYLVTSYPTQAARDAYEMVLEYAGEYDCVVCSGGDGTMNEAVNALMRLEKRPVFGYIPSGTTNDFAASLGLPRDMLEAAAVVTDGVAKPFDIGRFGDNGDEYFSYVAAFGLFTDVSYGTSQGMKNRLGHLAYLLEGVKRLGSIESYDCTITLEDETITGSFIFGMVSNSQSIGGFKITNERLVKMDDGLFEVILLKKPTDFFDLQNVIASLLNQEHYTDSLIVRRTASLSVQSAEQLAWTLDGEYGGSFSEINIVNCHHAVEIMMPAEELPK